MQIKEKSSIWLDQLSLMLNYFPYIIYILLMDQNGSHIIFNILPLAIFYAFRRTALFIFRDLRHNSQLLGWIGLIAAVIGNLIGIFGFINNLIFDISAVFVGSAAAIFPNALKQTKRLQPDTVQKNNPLITLVVLFGGLFLLAVISRFMPTLSFFLMFVAAFYGLFAYAHVYGMPKVESKIHFNWPNLLLIIIMLIAMGLIEAGRKQASSFLVEGGIALLAVFLIVLLSVLIFDNRQHFASADKAIYFQIMMYGVCAMFWITYSAVFVTIVHGASAFAWIFLAYIAGVFFDKPVVKLIKKILPWNSLTTNSFVIIIGILCTFWFPTYFIGVFLIRVFANAQKQIALSNYEKQSKEADQSVFLTYYLQSLSALWTQVIMWLTLILCAGNNGFNKLIEAMTFQHLAGRYLNSINLTHLILAMIMIAFVIFTYLFSMKGKDKDLNNQ